jgi:hypothetical protein
MLYYLVFGDICIQVALILWIRWPFSERIALNSETLTILQDLVESFDARLSWLRGQHRGVRVRVRESG